MRKKQNLPFDVYIEELTLAKKIVIIPFFPIMSYHLLCKTTFLSISKLFSVFLPLIITITFIID